MQNKKKILVLGDHPYCKSGIANSIEYFLTAMLKTGKYKFIVLGGAVRHVDMRPLIPEEWKGDLTIIPVEGYGTHAMVRDIVNFEKIDLVWFMTDPRYWAWLWQIENEIRPNVPMLYYHVWDNFPPPFYNKGFYLSNDIIVTMSQISSDVVKIVTPSIEEKYIPLTVDTNIFKPLPEADWLPIKPKNKMMFFWNNRNARRKLSGTLVWWFKEFLNIVGQDKACLYMHTDPKDPHGQDLEAVARAAGMSRDQFLISASKITREQLALFYNAADCVINISDAEGVGMGTMESLACGTPILVNMTGGLQEQVTDGKNWFGIGIKPASKIIVGSQDTPYIYEDRLSKEDFLDAMLKMYKFSPEERKNMGLMGRQHMINKYDLTKYASEWEKTLDETMEKYGAWETRKKYCSWDLKGF